MSYKLFKRWFTLQPVHQNCLCLLFFSSFSCACSFSLCALWREWNKFKTESCDGDRVYRQLYNDGRLDKWFLWQWWWSWSWCWQYHTAKNGMQIALYCQSLTAVVILNKQHLTPILFWQFNIYIKVVKVPHVLILDNAWIFFRQRMTVACGLSFLEKYLFHCLLFSLSDIFT